MNKKQVLKEYFSSLGKKGGPKGGKARTDSLTPEERTALAKKAAAARWGPKKATTKKKPAPKGE